MMKHSEAAAEPSVGQVQTNESGPDKAYDTRDFVRALK